MSLTILVFAKQVPDTANITGQAMKEDGTVEKISTEWFGSDITVIGRE